MCFLDTWERLKRSWFVINVRMGFSAAIGHTHTYATFITYMILHRHTELIVLMGNQGNIKRLHNHNCTPSCLPACMLTVQSRGRDTDASVGLICYLFLPSSVINFFFTAWENRREIAFSLHINCVIYWQANKPFSVLLLSLASLYICFLFTHLT